MGDPAPGAVVPREGLAAAYIALLDARATTALGQRQLDELAWTLWAQMGPADHEHVVRHLRRPFDTNYLPGCFEHVSTRRYYPKHGVTTVTLRDRRGAGDSYRMFSAPHDELLAVVHDAANRAPCVHCEKPCDLVDTALTYHRRGRALEVQVRAWLCKKCQDGDSEPFATLELDRVNTAIADRAWRSAFGEPMPRPAAHPPYAQATDSEG